MPMRWEPEKALADVVNGQAEDPSSAYAQLLGQAPVARYDHGEGRGTWGIFSHAEVNKAATDTKTFSNVTVPAGTPRILPLMADPPEHTAYRRLMNKFFAPGPIAAAEATVRPIAAEMIDRLIADGTADFAQGYAYPFSTRVLCAFLQVKDDWRIYNDWSSEMERLTGSGTVTPGSELPLGHIMKVVPYIQGLIDERRAEPRDDAVSGIIAGDIDGQKLDDQAIIGLVIALIAAGRSTTASGIGNLVLRLARDADLQSLLRAHPERIPDAVEESLRIETPQQEMPRMATCDVEVGGETIRAGDSVFLNWGSANVDPARWDEPGKFDLARKARQHFAFGRGVHQCFGAPLGRMEMRVTVEELLARTTSFALVGDISRHAWPRLSVETLPLTFVAAPAA